jgi:hypothetical protein
MDMFLTEATVVDQITQSWLSETQACHLQLAYYMYVEFPHVLTIFADMISK